MRRVHGPAPATSCRRWALVRRVRRLCAGSPLCWSQIALLGGCGGDSAPPPATLALDFTPNAGPRASTRPRSELAARVGSRFGPPRVLDGLAQAARRRPRRPGRGGHPRPRPGARARAPTSSSRRAGPAPARRRDRTARRSAAARPGGQARRRDRPALRRHTSYAPSSSTTTATTPQSAGARRSASRPSEPDRRAGRRRGQRSGTPRAWRCATGRADARLPRVEHGGPRYPELVLAVRRATSRRRGRSMRRRSPGYATGLARRWLTEQATIDGSWGQRRGRGLMSAVRRRSRPPWSAVRLTRRAEGLGPLRRALRDPGGPARRGPGLPALDAPAAQRPAGQAGLRWRALGTSP